MTGRLDGARILLVEDEAIIAMMAEDMLEEFGCRISATAATLGDALGAVAAGGFDAAILDVNLCGQPSLPVAEALRAAGKPFVFATGYGVYGLPDEMRDAPLLAKPYKADDLRAALARLLEP